MENKYGIVGIAHVGLPTNDLQKTVEFYKSLGFENCASHSRYFSDELDAQNSHQKGNKCLIYSYAYGILFL